MTDLWTQPNITILQPDFLEQIVQEAFTLLERIGVQIESREALDLLDGGGARIEGDRAYIPQTLIEQSCNTVPSSISLYDRNGELAGVLTDNNTHFNPGSAALNILDKDGKTIRKPVTADLVSFSSLVEHLENLTFQSTALICSDVPTDIADRYRLFIVLQFCSKPIVTGTFREDAFDVMHQMLCSVRGSAEALRKKPLAIFDCCPSSPLKWSRLTVNDLIKAARYGIPAELVSMPLSGAAAPVTLAGTLVQHTAEDISGIVIHQLAQPGSPIIYGGSPSIMDMKKGTTPMGAIETMMIDTAYAHIGKYFGFPTHAYMGLSDSKTMDYQAGLETGMGAIMAALAGINVVSGCGMLDFESCQSIEKLVADNEIAGMARRLARGIQPVQSPFAKEYFEEEFNGNFLASQHTMEMFQDEFFFPSSVIDRSTSQEWMAKDKFTAADKAKHLAEELLKREPVLPDNSIINDLLEIIREEFIKQKAKLPEYLELS